MRLTSINHFEEFFDQINVDHYSGIFIHSSLVRFGLIEGGVNSILDLLLSFASDKVNVAMPAFTWSAPGKGKWDISSSVSEVGALTEAFRHRSGVCRSIHPIHSISSTGKEVDFFCNHESHSSFGLGSSFQKMIDNNFLNVSIGANFEGGASFLHHAEEIVQVPYREYVPINCAIYADDVKRDRSFSYFARATDSRFNWQVLLEEFQARKLIVNHKVNGVECFCIPMKAASNHFVDMLNRDPHFVLEYQ